MPREVVTKTVLKAETRGVAQAYNEAARINKMASAAAKDQLKTTKDVEKELGRLNARLKDLSKEQLSLNKAMDGVEKGSEEYKKLTERVRELNKQYANTERLSRNIEKSFKDQTKAVTAAEMKKGSFAQGLIQGVAPGPAAFIQRGPGMWGQVAGMGIGRTARGIAGGISRAPFSGLSGIAEAISRIPGVGGFMAAPMMMAAAQAGPALAYRQQRMEALPYLGSMRGGAPSLTGITRPGRIPSDTLEFLRSRLLGQNRQEQAYQGIIGGGASLAGMAKPEATQFATQIARVGGGQALNMPANFFRTAFAAKTLYGAGADISGAFMQAGRRGGLVKGLGRESEALAEAIGQATASGLEGSEVNDYLSIVASGIQDWKRTGIPMNAESLSGITKGLSSALGGVRGLAIAQSMAQAAKNVAMSGPQGTMGLMMLQSMGYQGGGAGQYYEAKKALEEGKFGAKESQSLITRLTKMGAGGKTGRMYAQAELKSAGINLTLSDLEKIEAGGMSIDEATKGISAKGLQKRAAGVMDPSIVRQASIVNKQIDAGNKMLTSTQNMAETAANIAKTFSDVLSPKIDDLTKAILGLTKIISDKATSESGLGGGINFKNVAKTASASPAGKILGVIDMIIGE